MPINDIFQDIRVRLSLDAVSLHQVTPKPEYVPEVTKPESNELKRKPVAVAAPDSRNRTADHLSEYHSPGVTFDNTNFTLAPIEAIPGSKYPYTKDSLSDLPDDLKKSYASHPSPASYIHSLSSYSCPPTPADVIWDLPNTIPKQAHSPDSGYYTLSSSPDPSPRAFSDQYAPTSYPTPSTYPLPEPHPAPAPSPARISSYLKVVPNEPPKATPLVGTHAPGSSRKSRFGRMMAKLGLSKKKS